MKLQTLRGGLLLFLLCLAICYEQLSAVDAIDKERVRLGMEAARSVAKALKALKFVSWVAKIGSVAAPMLTAALFVVDIVFMFLGIESPEMLFMKSEFKNLNTRLDAFSIQFQEVKKKIDWSTIQLNYEKHESTINVLNAERMKVTEAKTAAEREDHVQVFIRKFENDFQMAAETLFHAMSMESILSDNVFEAARKYTDQHPEQSFHFMQGCVQLLLQAVAIQGTYIHLKYNNTHADEYFQKLTTEKMQSVAAKAREVYDEMQADFLNQLKLDVNRIALQNRQISHQDMVSLLYRYFTDKYINRYWFVFVYNDVSGYDKHAVYVCGGEYFFRLAGRNFVVASQDKNTSKRSGWSKAWADGVLDSFGDFRRDHDQALAVLEKIRAHNKECYPAAAIVVAGYEAKGFFSSALGHKTQKLKSAKWCNTELCWIWKRYYFAGIMFG